MIVRNSFLAYLKNPQMMLKGGANVSSPLTFPAHVNLKLVGTQK
jgi:hypothetical protein